jgi:hypothetical protein
LKIARTNSSDSNALAVAKVRTPVALLKDTFSPVGTPLEDIVLTSIPPLVTDTQVSPIVSVHVIDVSPPDAVYCFIITLDPTTTTPPGVT